MRRPTGSTLCLPAPSPPSSASAATTARPSSFPPTSCPKWKNSATPSASSNPASSSPKALSHSSAINTPNTNSRKSSSRSSLLTTSPRRPTDMSLRNVGIVYRTELTEALRDPRTVISTILVHLLLFPFLSVGFGSLAVSLVGKPKEEVPKVMLRGGEDSPEVVKGLQKLDTIEIVPETPGWKYQGINKEIPAAVEIPSAYQVDVARQKSDTVKIFNYQGEMKSEFASDKIETYMKEYRDKEIGRAHV